MPGTIQVTVVEFKGVSSDPSANSLKVSMGKTHYQTRDKGDFSFPITRIRENLVVALLDAGGNATAQQDIRTMQIIEKGCWDEVFSINGGGHVHLKLQFILTEEDRNRIRIMREAAMKKKVETNPNIKLRLTEGIVEKERASDYQKGFVETEGEEAGAVPLALPSPLKKGGGILESGIPSATHERVSTESQAHSDRRPVSRTPSSVRKMISAFESTKAQEANPLRKASSVPAQLNRLRKVEEKGHPVETVGGHESYVAPKELPESASSSGRTDEEERSRRGTGEECESSGMWIFPDNTRRLCVTTAGHRDKISKNVMHIESEKKLPQSETGSSPSNGLVGQVIRVVAIIGFGVLVLVTRQKEPRNIEERENEHKLRRR